MGLFESIGGMFGFGGGSHGGVTGAIQKLTVAQRRARDTRDLVQQYSRAYQIREADDRSKWLGTIIPLPDVDGAIVAIDYARMSRRFPAQKAALTRALNTKDPVERANKVRATCAKTVQEWDEIGAWPDDWARWQRALSDTLHWSDPTRLEDLR
jgi:hypothetical protein